MTAKTIGLAAFIAIVLLAEPAFAHHVMGGTDAGKFRRGPFVRPWPSDHRHRPFRCGGGGRLPGRRAGPALAISFVLAMIAGVALHLHGATVPAAEILVATSVIALGAVMLRQAQMPVSAALTLFVLVGLIHGYALGESIYGAERTPLYAYLLGLAVIQSAIAIVAMTIARGVTQRSVESSTLRLIGAGIAGVGLAMLVQQMIPAPPA